MFERKRRICRTEIPEAEMFLQRIGLNIYKLNLPGLTITPPIDDIYSTNWFEDLHISVQSTKVGVVAKVTGQYAVQCKTGRKESSGTWLPSRTMYHRLDETVILNS